jgi:Trk-type K+ transport system membrane component
VAATLNVVEPGLGQVGASVSYEIVNPFGRVVLTACMLAGRLEFFTALVLLSPAFWKRKEGTLATPHARLAVAPETLRWRRGLFLRGLERLPLVLH